MLTENLNRNRIQRSFRVASFLRLQLSAHAQGRRLAAWAILIPSFAVGGLAELALAQNLGVTMQAAPSIVEPGGRMAYQISVTNQGASSVSTTLQMDFDPHLSFQGITPPPVSCTSCANDDDCKVDGEDAGQCFLSNGHGTCSGHEEFKTPCALGSSAGPWTIGKLDSGQSVNFVAELEVSANASVSNPNTNRPKLTTTATTTTSGRPKTVSNSTSVYSGSDCTSSPNCGSSPIVTVISVAPGGSAMPEDLISYEAIVRNAGVIERDIKIVIELDSALEFEQSSVGSIDGNNKEYLFENVDAQKSRDLRINARVRPRSL